MKDRITEDDVKSKIDKVVYTVLEDGKTTIANMYMKNGFTIRGESACVDPANFDKALGEKYAYEQAFDKAWAYEAYLLSEERFKAGL